jgi:hypothetical protein
MMEIEGIIRTHHTAPLSVAMSLSPDNLSGLETAAIGDAVETRIRSCQLRSVIASVDDYLMNLMISEDLCTYTSL